MGLFNRKKEKSKENDTISIIDEHVNKIRNLVKNDDSISIMMITSTSKGCNTLIQGNAGDLKRALVTSASSNENFSKLIIMASSELTSENSLEKIFKGLDRKTSKNVNLPNGKRGLAINAEDVENITDKEIDDIVDNMIKGMSEDEDE
jgi:hypothetical protein